MKNSVEEALNVFVDEQLALEPVADVLGAQTGGRAQLVDIEARTEHCTDAERQLVFTAQRLDRSLDRALAEQRQRVDRGLIVCMGAGRVHGAYHLNMVFPVGVYV